jgi:acylphosphatase
MRRVRVAVSGRVQGVFYRATCAERARALGLAGSVRNLPDGRVEAVFEGSPESVEEAIVWCGSGTRGSIVDHVEVIDESPVGETGFRVAG